MVSLTCSTESTGGVTLVQARLEGGPVAHRVRLANRLDGPVWPPRREGVPEAGWDGQRFETVVPAGATVAVGYASPAEPAETPLELTERAVVAADDDASGPDAGSGADAPVRRDGTDADTPVTPSSAIQRLGDPSPPRDAVPVRVASSPAETHPPGERPQPAGEPAAVGPASAGPPAAGSAPDAVTDWLAAAEARIAVAERLAAAESLPAATATLRAVGGLDDAATLVDAVVADADALEALADRAAALADRADETDVPLSALERIA